MKIPYATPELEGSDRSRQARDTRHLVAQLERLRAHALSRANDEEQDHGPQYPANFTKGLEHNKFGLLANAADYRAFVKAINALEVDLFDIDVVNAVERKSDIFRCSVPKVKDCDAPEPPSNAAAYRPLEAKDWRGWESPRSGHVFSLQGPDSGAVGMAPAPRVGSSELAAEMAEVYGMALLRDVPFTEIVKPNGAKKKLCGHAEALLSSQELVDLLNTMPFYSGTGVTSSTPNQVAASGFNRFEQNRREARTGSLSTALTTDVLFRGSTPGARVGPYISQFMLVGNTALSGGVGAGQPSFPATSSSFELHDGFVGYGTQIIDQRQSVHKACLDYMTDWSSWLDVQNGANLKANINQFEPERRFITTPRDLATYVHFDALYQAYLNACLILLGLGTKTSKGFPEPSPSAKRDAFATFGGPHILSLVTEVATRCLKAVRRQKFNYHRRARPEALGGRLTLLENTLGVDLCDEAWQDADLGCSKTAFGALLKELPKDLRNAIGEHNQEQNDVAIKDMRRIICPAPEAFSGVYSNLLLPMAFPEGSPMHPAYGAGHATVAGGCVTMLKAFFEMYDDCDSGKLRELKFPCTSHDYFEPSHDGKKLVGKKLKKAQEPLTIQGELDKLAANISIGRNMAGVHYYSDYYDSLRMGERVAVGILLEQATCYVDPIEMTFDSFDGDRMVISGRGGSCPELIVHDRNGVAIKADDWWTRHVVGAAVIEDN